MGQNVTQLGLQLPYKSEIIQNEKFEGKIDTWIHPWPSSDLSWPILLRPELAKACLYAPWRWRHFWSHLLSILISFSMSEKDIWTQKWVQVSGFFLGPFYLKSYFPQPTTWVLISFRHSEASREQVAMGTIHALQCRITCTIFGNICSRNGYVAAHRWFVWNFFCWARSQHCW